MRSYGFDKEKLFCEKKMRMVSRNIVKDYDVEFSYPSNLSNKWTAFQHVIWKNPYKSFSNKNEAKKFLLPPTLTHLFSHTSIYTQSVLEMWKQERHKLKFMCVCTKQERMQFSWECIKREEVSSENVISSFNMSLHFNTWMVF